MAKTVWGGLLAAVVLAGAMACGGDSKNDCGDAAAYIDATCANTGDYADAKDWCENLSCTEAERQATIDCILAATCTPNMESVAMDCAADAGCDEEK